MDKILKRWSMILRLSVNDFKSKYSGSAVGALWAIAEPLATVLIYWFVYTVAVGGSMDEVPYYLWLSVGIAPWFFVSDGIRMVTLSYRDYAFLLKKTPIDKGVLPTARMLSAFISHIIFLAIVIVLCIAEGRFEIHLPSLCVLAIMSMLFVWVVGSITAVLCAKHRDTSNAVGIVLNAGFWLTPVFWNVGAVDGILHKLIMLNPAAIIVEGYRDAILYGNTLSLKEIAYVVVICAVFAVGGRFLKQKELPDISDSL